MGPFFRDESLAIDPTQRCDTLIDASSAPASEMLFPSCDAIASRLTQRRHVESSCESTRSDPFRLGFLPLAESDEYHSDDEDTLSRIWYIIEWKVAVNNKVISKDTDQGIILAPAVSRRMYLQPKVEKQRLRSCRRAGK